MHAADLHQSVCLELQAGSHSPAKAVWLLLNNQVCTLASLGGVLKMIETMVLLSCHPRLEEISRFVKIFQFTEFSHHDSSLMLSWLLTITAYHSYSYR